MRIVIDAMGGDKAPQAPVAGAVQAIHQHPAVEVTLVGPEPILRELLGSVQNHPRIHICPADDVILMDEAPVAAVRHKPNSSMVRAMQLVKEGKAEAVISAGNTGALMASGLLILGRIPGVERPALTAILPSMRGWGVLVLDVGANMDPRAVHLYQYAVMGAIYCEEALDIAKPRVGLLNVGEEAGKGPPIIREVYQRLEASDLNFIGNLEARELLQGKADVVVCEGFVGNVALKLTEGLGRDFLKQIKAILTRDWKSRLAALALKGGFYQLRDKLDYQRYGGAPLLGLEQVVYKCHGSSESSVFTAAIVVAHNYGQRHAHQRIRERLFPLEAES